MRAEADYAMTDQAMGGMSQVSDADKRLRVHFGLFPQINQAKSTAEGRPIYDEVTYVTIMVPGERDVVHRPAWGKDYNRFPMQHQAFLNKKDQDASSGTPLKMVTWLSAAQVKELEFFNCYTLEQLANLADSAASKFMGIQALKVRAKDFIKAAAEAAPLLLIRAEIDKKDEELAAANNALSEQGKRIAALEQIIQKAAK
jgi:hypothetical protein